MKRLQRILWTLWWDVLTPLGGILLVLSWLYLALTGGF